MSLHDVVIRLLYSGVLSSETVRDELIAQVEEDRAAQAAKERPQVISEPPASEDVPKDVPRYDPNTGERLS